MSFVRRLSQAQPALLGVAAVLFVAGIVAVPLDDGGSDAPAAGVRVSGDPSSRPGDGADTSPSDEGGTEAAVGAGDPAAPTPVRASGGDRSSAAGRDPDTGGAPAPGDTGGDPTGSSAQAAPASGRAIKLGILLLNVGNVEKLGVAVGVDPEQQRQAWEAFIAELNEQGGVNGRKVSAVYRQYDVTSNDSQRAACLAMTEDEKVFAVLDIALRPAHALCVADEHATPLVTLQPMPKQAYARSQGRLFTLFAEGSRVWRNVANVLHEAGRLKGRTIGILGDSAPGNPPTLDAFVQELESLGYEVAHRSELPSDGSTAQLPQASSQIPVEVQQMRQKGVDLVFLATGVVTATHFAQTADSQGYRPAYAATDWADAYSDTYVGNMPRSFQGTLVTTNRTGEFRVRRPEPERDRACRAVYERRTGQKLDRTTVQYNSTVRLCTLLDVFARGATAAGRNLTKETLSAGIQRIGPLPLSTFGGGSFRAGKFDAADRLRTAAFDGQCRCWIPRTEFRDVRYR